MSPESETPNDPGSSEQEKASPRPRTAPRATAARHPAAKSAAAQRTTAAKPQAPVKPRTPSKPQTPSKPSVQRSSASAARPSARPAAKKSEPPTPVAAETRPTEGTPEVEPAAEAPESDSAVTIEELFAEETPDEQTTDAAPVDAPLADAPLADAPSADTPPADAALADAPSADTPSAAKPARTPAGRKPAAPRTGGARGSAAAPGPVAAKAPARRPAKPRPAPRSKAAAAAVPSVVRDLDPTNIALSITGLTKRFGSTVAVAGIDIDVPQGSFYGIVGPNGAGKTTTLSMVTGMLRPDGGTITVLDTDVWRDSAAAKRLLGVLPDRLRLFDRLTGRQLLYYSGTLRRLDNKTVTARSADLAAALGLEDALGRLVSDYSAGMTKKLALACAMIHSPRVLVLDEPFESIDPVSAANVTEILEKYVAGGGTVVVSSHSMDMIQRVCDRVAIIVEGSVLAKGTVDEVRAGETLEERFMELAGTRRTTEGMEWLLSSSD